MLNATKGCFLIVIVIFEPRKGYSYGNLGFGGGDAGCHGAFSGIIDFFSSVKTPCWGLQTRCSATPLANPLS